ncbi:MAG TPA: SDR family oxidoreductase [Candidatus Paceibacterota bacterium]|nr:SDR family oxidoreductase [Candidatus Paceibacterota bacterium]
MNTTNKRALICGTRPDSIGRHIAEHLIKNGWEVWLYSRSAYHSDSAYLHVRAIDVSNLRDVQALLDEMGQPDLVVFAADTGTGFGNLESLSAEEIESFINAKVTGSVLLSCELMRRSTVAKLIWLCGHPGPKPSEFLLYGPVNAFILMLTDSINRTSKNLTAFYLETPVTRSPIGKMYERRIGPIPSEWEVHKPSDIIPQLQQVLSEVVKPGIVLFGRPTQ